MVSLTDQPPLTAPRIAIGAKLRRNLFGNPRDAVLTIVLSALLIALAVKVIDWTLISAVSPFGTNEDCAVASGACWPFLVEKYRLILFGTYPYDQQWRAAIASVLMVTGVGISMLPSFHNARLFVIWGVLGFAFYLLMRGGAVGLEQVAPQKWSGLPILLMFAVFGLVFAFPLGVVLALARTQTSLPAVKAIAVGYIELVRGVPMIMVLFLGLFVLPLMMPAGVQLDPLLTTMIALVLFHAAYFAEAVRGGLQSVPRDQTEAAQSQGFTYVQTTRLIVLPQALSRAMPAIMNTVLGAYKDTSLVVIIGIHDMMATAKMAFSDPNWQRYGIEAYLFIAAWYLTTCWCLSSYSRWLERRLSN